MKKLSEYKSLSQVPLNHPDVKYRCTDPGIICGEACGAVGCLGGKDSEGCPYKSLKQIEEIIEK